MSGFSMPRFNVKSLNFISPKETRIYWFERYWKRILHFMLKWHFEVFVTFFHVHVNIQPSIIIVVSTAERRTSYQENFLDVKIVPETTNHLLLLLLVQIVSYKF